MHNFNRAAPGDRNAFEQAAFLALLIAVVSCGGSSTTTVQADASQPEASGDGSNGVLACPTTIDAYCASAFCVRNWSDAQKAAPWCTMFEPNGQQVSVGPSCGALPYNIVEFGATTDCIYRFYYAPNTGEL